MLVNVSLARGHIVKLTRILKKIFFLTIYIFDILTKGCNVFLVIVCSVNIFSKKICHCKLSKFSISLYI